MAEKAHIILRKVYVWRVVLFGFLYGLLIGSLSISIGLWLLWNFSQLQGITPPGITSSDLVTFGFIGVGVFVVIATLGSMIVAILYNLLAKLGAGLHFELEEKDVEFVSAATV